LVGGFQSGFLATKRRKGLKKEEGFFVVFVTFGGRLVDWMVCGFDRIDRMGGIN